jgi:Carboxypeptidase regulatory-like domain
MNRPFLLVLAAFVLGAGPAPLVVGSVRDQEGAPIAGALVRLAGTAQAAGTRTAPDGTFALEGAADAVEITCEYCRPNHARVAADGTVTAIVQR